MKLPYLSIALSTAGLMLAPAAIAKDAPAAAAPTAAPAPANDAWPEAYFEIFKLAPGKQEEFIRRVARNDEVSRAGNQPPIQLYIHQDGADWDVLLLKPARTEKPTPAQEAAMAAKRKELGVESGPAYFVAIRELIAAHTDTKTYGPITAAQWVARLDQWRAEHPKK